MKVAVATDDKKTIRRGHFGDAEVYVIFTVENGEIVNREERENPYTDEKLGITEHNLPHKARLILEFLKDCDVFIGRAMGHKNRKILEEKGIKVYLTQSGKNAEEAVREYLKGVQSQDL